MFNNTLLELARYTLQRQLSEKQAFQPPVDPSTGGPPPGGGGGPTAGGDPSSTMPMDPTAMAAAAGGGGGGLDPETIRSIIRQEMAAGGGGGGAGGAGGGAGGKPVKADINTVANDIFQVKKILTYLMNMFQIPLPPEIIDGPNRDPATGAALPPNTPGSTSDPNQQTQQPSTPPSAIKPIEAMQAAMPQDAGGVKTSADEKSFKLGEEARNLSFEDIYNRAVALTKLAQSLKARQGS